MIWLIGCKGMLGTEVGKQLDEKKLPWVGTDKEVDITNPQALEDFVNKRFPSNVIRCKGLVWFAEDYDMSYLFEQAGKQMQLSQIGYWLASAPEDELRQMIAQEPEILKDWDKEVGDRMVKLVFIGRNMDKEEIFKQLNNCLN